MRLYFTIPLVLATFSLAAYAADKGVDVHGPVRSKLVPFEPEEVILIRPLTGDLALPDPDLKEMLGPYRPPPMNRPQFTQQRRVEAVTPQAVLPEKEAEPASTLEQAAKVLQTVVRGAADALSYGPPAPKNQTQQGDEPELLVLKITSKGYVLSHGAAAYDLNDKLYISLYDLNEALMFSIDVYDEELRAEGWFIDTSRKFYLDVNAKQVVINGTSQALDETDYTIQDDEIYISTKAIEDWFGVEHTLNFSLLKLDITATDKLNFEEIVEREKRWADKKKKRIRKRITYLREETPYALVEPPSLTVQMGTSYANSAGKGTRSDNYFVQGVGDLGWMSSDYFVNGNDVDHIADARIRLYRFDEDGGAIPLIGATQFELGDISPPSLDIVGGGGNERGVYVSNRNSQQTTSTDNLLIDGEIEPGWEVELYRNNEFLSFLTSADTQNGRYEFSGLSLDAGTNIFKIIKYGPSGEKETETRSFLMGAGMLTSGQINYDFSLSQPNRQVIPVSEDYELGGKPRLIAGLEFGVFKALSLGAGFYSGPLFDQNRSGAVASLRNSLLGVYSKLDHLLNTDDTSVTALSQKTNLGDFNLAWRGTYYNGFSVDEQDQEYNLSTDVGTSITLFGTGVSLRGGVDYESYLTDRTVTKYSNQISTSIMGYALSNQINWEFDQTGNTETETMNGEIFFREYFQDILFDTSYGVLFRARSSYTVKPMFEFNTLNLSADKNLTKAIRLGLSSQHALGEVKSNSFGADLAYDHDYFTTQFGSTYNEEGDYTLTASLRFHVGPDLKNRGFGFIPTRQSQRGMATAFVYNDVNYNGMFDAGDEPLEGVNIRTDNGLSGLSDDNGLASLQGLTGFRKTQIILQSHTLPDIFMVPNRKGLEMIPRPGHAAHFEFPVVLGGEIDGMILSFDKELEKTFDFSIFRIELVGADGQIANEVEADQTGYYLFEQVVPGDYVVRIHSEVISALALVGEFQKAATLSRDELVLGDVDFTVLLPYGPIEADFIGPRMDKVGPWLPAPGSPYYVGPLEFMGPRERFGPEEEHKVWDLVGPAIKN